MPPLSYRIDGDVAKITIDNPPQNRYTQEVFDQLAQALVAIGNSDARAVLLHATGSDFSYGGDMLPWPNMTARELRTMFEQRLATVNAFESLSIPTVAAVQDDALLDEASALVEKLAAGPTQAHAAHKALLRAWATGGVPAGDAVLYDIAMPLFQTDDEHGALPAAVDTYVANRPRAAFHFTGR
jgi:enoyl-CoA hydratase/carnithine racemase